MIIQEDVPYTKEEVKAMVKTIHYLREQLKQLGWHSANELPNLGEEVVTWVNHEDGVITVSRGIYVGWPEEIINKLRWCYPPKFD